MSDDVGAMSPPMNRRLIALLALPLLAACSAQVEGDDASDEAAVTKTATISFKADWTVSSSKKLATGTKVTIAYDTARTPCTGTSGGYPAFSTTAWYQLGTTAPKSVVVAGLNPSGPLAPTFTIPSAVLGEGAPANDLAIWFESTSRWGCHSYDSAYGKNFHFPITVPASAPDWMGKTWVVTSRATCNDGKACPGDGRALGTGFVYDSWVEQRAAIRQVSFEAYEPGVTDWNNPDAWKKLDARIYTRIGGSGSFSWKPVSIAGFSGNNVSYAVDLRPLQPFSGNTITNKTDCPKFPYVVKDALVEADVQFYFQVNGVELRPADGTVYHGAFQSYSGLLAICK